MNHFPATVLALFVALWSVTARADIAPTIYVGRGITPVNAPGIRMVSAEVRIDWGTPCTLSAVFVMDNETPKAADVQLGFPLSLPQELRSKDALDFAMTFDGVPEDPALITEVGPSRDSFPDDTTWYRCGHTFRPGKTTVIVTTKLPATEIFRQPDRQSLAYCIQTGAAWTGTIGSEDVTINFPKPLTPAQILKALPFGYTINGNSIHWQFKNFKPHGQDHDIYLEYLRPHFPSKP